MGIDDEIQRDLPRTFPNHQTFKDPSGQEMLHDVLRAFAHHFPRIGYCQGINFIAALFLVVFGEAEPAFWALICAVESLGLEDYYTEGMTLLRADMLVLSLKLPRNIRRHLKDQKVDILPICSEWFLTWFARSFPIHTVLRIWDVLFWEGHTCLFRVTVGVFKRVKADLLQCFSFDEIMNHAKTWPQSQIDHDAVVRHSQLTLTPLRLYEHNIFSLRQRALTFLEAGNAKGRMWDRSFSTLG